MKVERSDGGKGEVNRGGWKSRGQKDGIGDGMVRQAKQRVEECRRYLKDGNKY